MKRKLVLAIFVALSLPSLGCTVRAGLASAPALGTTPGTERRVHDVVANGIDSCERRAAGSPLRGRLPPCANDGTSPPSANFQPIAQKERTSDGWMNPIYLRWPSCVAMSGEEETFASGALHSGWSMSCAGESR